LLRLAPPAVGGGDRGDSAGARGRRGPATGRTRVDDKAAVGDRVAQDRLLEEPVEQQSAPARAPSVEAEGELVEVGVEVLGADLALVGTEQPALKQARDAVHARHQYMCGILVLAENGPLVLVAALGHGPVGLVPVAG
jgi:hypothetical protein